MAVELSPHHFGELIDPHGGRDDLEKRFIRVLHENSFIDDATRIWRALRYEQRLDFYIEPSTLELIKRDMPMLNTISGDRIRHELELILHESLPEKTLLRADELKVLPRIHSTLRGDGWLAEHFTRARQLNLPNPPSVPLYLALLAYRLNAEEIKQLISFLKLPGSLARVLRDTIAIKNQMKTLSSPGLAPSQIHALLHGYAATAYTANTLASDSVTAAEHIELFINVLCHVRPVLNGDDIKKLGIPSGPRIRQSLQMLREARLDGKLHSRHEEEMMVKKWGNQA